MRTRIYTYLEISKASELEQIVIWDTPKIRIGRHPEQDIVLADPEVSRDHAVLQREGENHIVADLRTANNTFVNGKPIQSVVLEPDDLIQIGVWSFRFRQSRDNPAATNPDVTYASHLKDLRFHDEDERERTMLGIPEDDFPELGSGGGRRHPGRGEPERRAAPAAPVRDLDAELGAVAVPEEGDGSTPGRRRLEPKGEAPPPTLPTFREDADAELAPPVDEDPLFDAGAALAPPLPPATPRTTPPSALGAKESSAPTLPRPPLENLGLSGSPGDAVAGGEPQPLRNIDITLQIDGVDPELFRLLQSILGRKLDLSRLSVLLKAIATR